MRKWIWIAGMLLLSVYVIAEDIWDHSIPGLGYLHRTTTHPWDIHVLIVDLKNPGVSTKVTLAQDHAYGREIISTMAERHGMTAAINGDFSSLYNGIPQGITVLNNEIVIAPKYRTALGFTENNSADIGMWTNRWNWYATVSDESNNTHDVVMMNLDVNENWLCLFTDLWGTTTPGRNLSANVVEVIVGPDSLVQNVRHNQSGVLIPEAYYVLTGRESAADWLLANIEVGEQLTLDLTTLPDWHNLHQAVSGGPRFVENGQYYADPMVPFPGGEDFTMSYKNAYYHTRQPRSSAGITVNGDTLIMVVVDGRQTHSIGMTLSELAALQIEFGAVDAVQFDSGGSATFYFDGSTRNSPSDGSERPQANALCVRSEAHHYINIAPEALITAYSDETLPDHPVTKLVDGDRSQGSGKWADLTSNIPWVELDLGTVMDLTHFQLFHTAYAGDENYLNTREFKVYTRQDTSAIWEEDFHVLNDVYEVKDNLCTYSSPKAARFVRLEILQSNHLDYEDYLRQPEFSIYMVDPDWTGIDKSNQAVDFQLSQNYPNPFNPSTTIRYQLGDLSDVSIIIYDVMGREVADLVQAKQASGWYDVQWNGTTDAGNPVSTGLYFARIQAGGFSDVIKMAYIK
ncbi:MAG: phosphodiester glycosidase family protein [Candidatus Marinimicrobia bacterium]|nr:phosphodiester glycosidase family protein [Candidatus Neomarinimicrobiota bacterium]